MASKRKKNPLRLSKRRIKAMLAAEEVCRLARFDIATYGVVRSAVIAPYVQRWLMLSGAEKFEQPKPLRRRRGEA